MTHHAYFQIRGSCVLYAMALIMPWQGFLKTTKLSNKTPNSSSVNIRMFQAHKLSTCVVKLRRRLHSRWCLSVLIKKAHRYERLAATSQLSLWIFFCRIICHCSIHYIICSEDRAPAPENYPSSLSTKQNPRTQFKNKKGILFLNFEFRTK